MAFTTKDWRDATSSTGGGDTSTPITAAALEDLESRLAAYTDTAPVTLNAQTTDYTLVLGDAGKLVTMSSGSARTVTIPPNGSVAFAAGTVVMVEREGTGTVTLVPGSGVTLNSPGGLAISAQYGTATAIKMATNTWLVGGMV